MKNVYLLILIPIVFSCSKNSDFLLDFNIGENESQWKEKIQYHIENGSFIENEYGYFNSSIVIGKEKIKIQYKVNKPFSSKKNYYFSEDESYERGNLRIVVINLGGDSTCYRRKKEDTELIEKKFIDSYGPQDKHKIELIRYHLINAFGQPKINSVEIERDRKLTLDEFYDLSLETAVEKYELKDLWELDNYKIKFFRDSFYFDECFNKEVCRHAYLVFESLNYEGEIEEIRNEIRKNFTPNDLITIAFKKPIFQFDSQDFFGQNYQLYQSIESIERLGPEEERSITDVKFDIVYYNRFQEEIVRIKNCQYEFANDLNGYQLIGFPSDVGYIIKYGNSTDQGIMYDNIREHIDEYSFNGKGKIIADVQKIVYMDGTVLE